MTMERTLNRIFGYSFENVFTSIEKKLDNMEGSHKWKTVTDIDTVPLQKKSQTSIGSYFGLPKTTKIAVKKKKKTKVKTGHRSTRTFQPVTAEKMKTTSPMKFGSENWFIIGVENNLVKSLRCSVCQKYEDRITSVKGFQENWCCEESR